MLENSLFILTAFVKSWETYCVFYSLWQALTVVFKQIDFVDRFYVVAFVT